MKNCAETMMQGFTDRQSVLVPSPYAYQRGVSLVEARMGRDNQTKAKIGSINGVSIHAPAWGATQ